MSEIISDGLISSTLSVDDRFCTIYVPSQISSLDTSFPWRIILEKILVGQGLDESVVRLGRGGIFFFSGNQLPFPIVVRQYRHGGLWRFLSGARFFSKHRFLAELKVHSRVVELGLPTPEVLGVIVVKEKSKSIFVNGYYVTRRLLESVSLPEFLNSAGAATRLQIAYELGAGLRKLHENGVFYTDMHVKNILVGPGGKICFIDFDKAGQFSSPLSYWRRRANLYRFLRSVEKYCFRGGKWTDTDRSAFLIAYEPDPKKYLKLFFQLNLGLSWRRLFYKFGWWLNRS